MTEAEEVAALARQLAEKKSSGRLPRNPVVESVAANSPVAGCDLRVADCDSDTSTADQSTNSKGPSPKPKEGAKEYTEEDFAKLLAPQTQPDKYKLVEFRDPAELLYIVDPNFRDGRRDLYGWQMETHDLFVKWKYTEHDPLKFYLRAANGSGKDAYVIAPFAVWFALCKVRSRVIITSSSYQQLETQTESYIRTLCAQVNEYFQEEVFYIRKLHIICKWTGSEIKLFSTDDPGRAEGYHPFPDYAGAEMAIVVNEAKTVPDCIFEALKRCTGYNYWLEVSSPGQTSGHFYNVVTNAVDYVAGTTTFTGASLTRKVTAYECDHFSKQSIDREGEEVGRESSWFRSSKLAEFTTQDESVVISRELIEKVLRQNTRHMRVKGEVNNKKCGTDLGFSKDETVSWVIDGNKLLDSFEMVQNDTTVQVDRLCMFYEKHNLKGDEIAVDDSNFGHSVNDMLGLRGYQVRRVTNQSRAYSSKIYGNRGAEMWFNFKRLLELGLVCGLDRVKHKILIEQLCNRYYKQTESNGKIYLESKKEARANGHGSPDRADALVLAFSFYNVNDFLEEAESVEETTLRQKSKGKLAADFARDYEERVTYKGLHSSGTEAASSDESSWKLATTFQGRIPSVVGFIRKRIGNKDSASPTKPYSFKTSLD